MAEEQTTAIDEQEPGGQPGPIGESPDVIVPPVGTSAPAPVETPAESDAKTAPAAPSTADIVRTWFRDRIACGAVARDTLAYNQVADALDDLIARLVPPAAPLPPA